MTSEDGKENLSRNVERKSSSGSDSQVSMSSEEDGKVLLIEENSRIFNFFKVLGLYDIHYDESIKKYRMSQGQFLVNRFFWSLFHLTGLGLGIYLNSITATDQDSSDTVNIFLWSSILVFAFIIVDPIQTIILRRSLEILPDLLNNEVKHLERLTKEKFGNAPRKVGLSPRDKKIIMNHPQKTSDVEDGVDTKSKNSSLWNSMKKFIYKWQNRVTLLLLIATFLGLFFYGFWLEADWTAARSEPTLIVMIFYLIFPMFSTWFCVVFIEYERQLYKLIADHITDEDFVDENKIKDIADYIKTMQVLFRTITGKFFKFIFGMNSMIFVISGIYCMFELLDGFDAARESANDNIGFREIFFAIPLAFSIFHIFVMCKASNSLISGEHKELCVRLMFLMTSLLMEGKDKPMKKIEMLYKNLKDCPPQAEIYGGYKINYQILTGMVIFMISYARIFQRIFQPGSEDPSTSTNGTDSMTNTTESRITVF